MQPPILETVEPVVATARHVRVDLQEVEKVAAWMAYEELPYPDFFSPLNPDSDIDTLDFICLYNSINFAFTDFDTHKMFRIRYAGAERSDTDAMVACLKRAYDRGTPILEGSYLGRISRPEIESIFDADVSSPPIPMLGRRLEIFHEVGSVLADRHSGRFHHFVRKGPARLYADGLTQQINRRHPENLQVIEPVIDARLWTHFHATHHPHHLTRTTAY